MKVLCTFLILNIPVLSIVYKDNKTQPLCLKDTLIEQERGHKYN